MRRKPTRLPKFNEALDALEETALKQWGKIKDSLDKAVVEIKNRLRTVEFRDTPKGIDAEKLNKYIDSFNVWEIEKDGDTAKYCVGPSGDLEDFGMLVEFGSHYDSIGPTYHILNVRAYIQSSIKKFGQDTSKIIVEEIRRAL